MNPNTHKLSVVMHENKLQSAADNRHWSKESQSRLGFLAKAFSLLANAFSHDTRHKGHSQETAPRLRSADR